MEVLPYPYIDIHTHRDILKRNSVVSVCSFFVQNYQDAINKHGNYFTIGLHPWHTGSVDLEESLSKIEQVALLPECIGIGEIGLDHVITAPFDKQLVAFERQLILAKKMKLPVIIHNVKSFSEILHAIKIVNFDCPVIFHGFTGKIQMAQQILHGGAYLSFGKSLSHSYIRSALDLVPVNRIFFETDEGSCTIEEVYDVAIKLLHTPVERCTQFVYENFINVFTKYNG
jgi:TatD DNase family protein